MASREASRSLALKENPAVVCASLLKARPVLLQKTNKKMFSTNLGIGRVAGEWVPHLSTVAFCGWQLQHPDVQVRVQNSLDPRAAPEIPLLSSLACPWATSPASNSETCLSQDLTVPQHPAQFTSRHPSSECHSRPRSLGFLQPPGHHPVPFSSLTLPLTHPVP